MILLDARPTCAHRIFGDGTLLCDREPGHRGAHTYHDATCPDGRHDDVSGDAQ